MTDNEFRRKCLTFARGIKRKTPRDKGNLQDNAEKWHFNSPKEFVMYIDTSVAPYAVYTVFPWISPRWHGRKNPNQWWWQKAILQRTKALAKSVNGELIK